MIPRGQLVPSTGIIATPFDNGPPPGVYTSTAGGAVAESVGRGAVTVRVSKLLDIPKDGSAAGRYRIEVSTQDKQTATVGPVEALRSDGLTEDVEIDSGDATVTTASPELLVKVFRVGRVYGSTFIGEASIHRLDSRSRTVCPYALSSKDIHHPGGIELIVVERPPGQAIPEREGLYPSQHHALALIYIENLVMLPPSDTWQNSLEIRIEPGGNVSASDKKALTAVVGTYTPKPDPQKKKLMMVDVQKKVEYKGMMRGERGGVIRTHISAWYKGYTQDTKVGGINVDVTFASAPVQFQQFPLALSTDGGKAVGGIYVGHQLVEENEYRRTHPEGVPADGTNAEGASNIAKPEVLKDAKKPDVQVFPDVARTGEKEQLQELQERVAQLDNDNALAKKELEKLKAGEVKPSKFEAVMESMGPPSIDMSQQLAKGLTSAMYYARKPKDAGPHADVVLMQAAPPPKDINKPTPQDADSVVPVEMIDPLSLPSVSFKFADVNPAYDPTEDVWGLVQPKPHTLTHHQPSGVQKGFRTRPVREDCILA
jgi:hypothetical protein